MANLPYLQSYNAPKLQKAYERYLAGDSQRKVAKSQKIPERTLAWRSKKDGWEAERQARKIAAKSPNVANVAAVAAKSSNVLQQEPSSTIDPTASRNVRMEQMLARQQRLAGALMEAYEQDVQKVRADAAATGKPLTRSQIAQLTILGNNLLTMERKAWCVPDKIETKDMTPTPADRVRSLKDEELQSRLNAARRSREQAERRRGTAAPRGRSSAPSVN